MSREAINEKEWNDPNNWYGPKWLSLYFSRKDSRVWVRKQVPAFGWTVNLAHRKGWAWLLGIGGLAFGIWTICLWALG